MFKRIALIIVFLLFPQQVFAQTPQAHTVVINQVRGVTCCDVGSADFFQKQIDVVSDLQMPATFTLRYDTMFDEDYLSVINSSPNIIEYGGFLEVIPSLAADAGVTYSADDETWYEAQYAFLIGYSQQDRKKLIDTFMGKYFEVFGRYPKVTTAWMIDAWSLHYLKQEYGIVVHQITREQYGTDSYALYGGPAHYPYWPADNWALIPSDTDFSASMPLIVRQTITDPVENYGDDSSLHTSQPNDYLQDPEQDIEYFAHLFNQAHAQHQPITFALLGLENSMDQVFQDEFEQQLKLVNDWRQQSATNQIISATDLETWYKNQAQPELKIYAGSTYQDQNSKAWWITTSKYRARVRFDQNQLYISDLRLYDSSFVDPYLENQAQNLGWWVVPFVVDGSRFFHEQIDPEPNQLALDSLADRKEIEAEPTRVVIADDVQNVETRSDSSQMHFLVNNQSFAVFTEKGFSIPESAQIRNNHPWLEKLVEGLDWISKDGSNFWGFQKLSTENGSVTYQAYTDQSADLDEERSLHYSLLFPELTNRALSTEKSYLYTNNQYAIVGRNPVRLVLFPRDEYDAATLLENEPEVSSQKQIDSITLKRQHGNSGMIFIDFENQQPLSTKIHVSSGEFSAEQTIYFAPNCKQQVMYCLSHPRHSVWYLKAVLDDRRRAKEEVLN